MADKTYQFLIFIDTATGKEVYRQAVPDANRGRADVARAYPAIMNAGQSGYQLGLAMPAQLKGKTVRIIHRYSGDKAGNGNYVDAYSNPVLMARDVMRTPIDYRLPSETVPYPDVSKLKDFWIHVRIGQNRVYMMDGNQVIYTMYCRPAATSTALA